MAGLPKSQNYISHICKPLLLCKPSAHLRAPLAVQAQLFHHHKANLFTKVGALDCSSNMNRCLEILDAAAASSNHAPNKRIFVQRDLSCLHLILSKHNIYILYQNPSQSRISNVSVLISLVSLTFLCSLEL